MAKMLLPISGTGKVLAEFLCKAAGLTPREVRSIEVRCAVNELITFKVEMMAEDEKVSAALKTINATALCDEIASEVVNQ